MDDDSDAETAEESSSTLQTPDASCYLRVANTDHSIEIVSNGEGLGIEDLIKIVIKNAHELCEALPVMGARPYESEKSLEKCDDPSVC